MVKLRDSTINGLFWNFIGNFANQAITFIVGIILARLLTPREYGLIGMITVLIVISQTFIESGFRQALIRKKNCTESDFSTVFHFNFLVAITFYLILFICANQISSFFNEPELKSLIRAVGITLIISSFSIIQTTILAKQLNFKLLTKINFISAILSGIIGILLANHGFGVWSLVWRQIIGSVTVAVLLWVNCSWTPQRIFSSKSFRELFGFGSKILASNIIDQLYWNVYYIVIGKYFSSQALGFYTRAEMFKNLPSQNITSVISVVTFPALSELQNDVEALRSSFKKVLISTALISFSLIIGLAVIAKPLVIVLIGEKWIQSAVYLQLLCASAVFFPMSLLNSNIFKIVNRSDFILKLEIFKKTLAIPSIIFGIIYGMKTMIILMIINAGIDYLLNSYFAGKLINYPLKKQALDIFPSLMATALMGFLLVLSNYFFHISSIISLIMQVISGFSIIIFLGETFKFNSYTIVKSTLLEFLLRNKSTHNNTDDI